MGAISQPHRVPNEQTKRERGAARFYDYGANFNFSPCINLHTRRDGAGERDWIGIPKGIRIAHNKCFLFVSNEFSGSRGNKKKGAAMRFGWNVVCFCLICCGKDSPIPLQMGLNETENRM
ncbi:hypothetical protein CDAR_85021 [Caerostris darwini]|uniref:Uncharacterized protein n=1 Tax=Caerostris darwini TaxID=1538125 RepID=A0AAV4MZX1_9ARAC|nr:hypothetical protein CDAR_85021 [Caerostris darwini]